LRCRQTSRIEQIGNAGLGQWPARIDDAETSRQGRRKVKPQLGDGAARHQIALEDGTFPEAGRPLLARLGTGVIGVPVAAEPKVRFSASPGLS
jgi:hypothetical protein